MPRPGCSRTGAAGKSARNDLSSSPPAYLAASCGCASSRPIPASVRHALDDAPRKNTDGQVLHGTAHETTLRGHTVMVRRAGGEAEGGAGLECTSGRTHPDHLHLHHERSIIPSRLTPRPATPDWWRVFAEHAVLVGECLCRCRLQKCTGSRLRCALLWVRKAEHSGQRRGVFRKCANARSEAFVTLSTELQAHRAVLSDRALGSARHILNMRKP